MEYLLGRIVDEIGVSGQGCSPTGSVRGGFLGARDGVTGAFTRSILLVARDGERTPVERLGAVE